MLLALKKKHYYIWFSLGSSGPRLLHSTVHKTSYSSVGLAVAQHLTLYNYTLTWAVACVQCKKLEIHLKSCGNQLLRLLGMEGPKIWTHDLLMIEHSYIKRSLEMTHVSSSKEEWKGYSEPCDLSSNSPSCSDRECCLYSDKEQKSEPWRCHRSPLLRFWEGSPQPARGHHAFVQVCRWNYSTSFHNEAFMV